MDNLDHAVRPTASAERAQHGLLRAMLCAMLCACGLVAQDTAVKDSVDAARGSLDRWVELRRTISEEKRDWRIGKEILLDRTQLLRREIESLHNKITDLEASITQADQKKTELIVQRDRLRDASASLEAVVRPVETKTLGLLEAVPDRLRDLVRPFSQRIPTGDGATKLSLGERYQNVIVVLNAVNDFQQHVIRESEVRDLGNGTNAEVTAVYFGLGQALYVDAKGRSAGIGTVDGNRWVWKADDPAAPAIAEIVAILANEKSAAFVRVPVEIK